MKTPGTKRVRGRGASSILRPAKTCWRLAHADHLALIIDAAEYFAALKAAMLRAEHSIFLIGWDFDFRISLDPDNKDDQWPDILGDLIDALVAAKPNLVIRILRWDIGLLASLSRGSTPLYLLRWKVKERVDVRLDKFHPLGACHHQKIAVIDDAFAFCGGIDATIGRWDTRSHLGRDKRRDSPWGFAQEPWHDATTAVDGDAARALGQLARERWRLGTGEKLPAPRKKRVPWPVELPATFTDIKLGIARTQPHHEKQRAAHEIEALSLAAIKAARRTIYIESQYVASRKIGDALAARLAEKGGPDVVIVNPKTAGGWLEEEVMGPARALIVAMLRHADHEDRFRIYFPVATDGTAIYVHAKVMIIDDCFLKVGSSNINNRSMGLDTECDLAIEADMNPAQDQKIGDTITAISNDLLAEHLGVEPSAVAAARRKAKGSLVKAIEALAKPRGRTLKQLRLPKFNDLELRLAENGTLDPERPASVLPKLKDIFG